MYKYKYLMYRLDDDMMMPAVKQYRDDLLEIGYEFSFEDTDRIFQYRVEKIKTMPERRHEYDPEAINFEIYLKVLSVKYKDSWYDRHNVPRGLFNKGD